MTGYDYLIVNKKATDFGGFLLSPLREILASKVAFVD